MSLQSDIVVTIFILCARFDGGSTQIVTPTAALVLVGNGVTFKCLMTSGGQWGIWTVHYLTDQTCELNRPGSPQLMSSCADRQRTVLSTQQEYVSSYGNHFYVTTLRLSNVSLANAGTYVCNYGNMQSHATLTVLESAPSGQWSPTYVIGGQTLTLTCRVSYNGSFAPRATWTNGTVAQTGSGGKVPNEVVASRTTGSTNDTLMHLVSTLSIRVETGKALVDPFTCVISLPGPAQSDAGGTMSSYSWSSPAIAVSYCPRNVAILSTSDVITLGTQLQCVSEAHPAATYRWAVLAGSGFVSGRDNETLTVMSTGGNGNRFHVMCMAVNFLRGSDSGPCFASTEIHDYDGINVAEHDIFANVSTKATATTTAPVGKPRPHERTSRSEQSAIDQSLTDADKQQPGDSASNSSIPAVVILSVLMSLVIGAVIVIGAVLARVVSQLHRQVAATPVWRPVERQNSAKSVTTEMSALTATDTI